MAEVRPGSRCCHCLETPWTGSHASESTRAAMSRFQTTRWSLIEEAREHPSRSRAALEQLCRAYRPPVLAFVRHSGYGTSDAEDLTQAFFLRFLEHGWYADATPERGRFRSLLLTSLRHFLSDQHAQASHASAGAVRTVGRGRARSHPRRRESRRRLYPCMARHGRRPCNEPPAR